MYWVTSELGCVHDDQFSFTSKCAYTFKQKLCCVSDDLHTLVDIVLCSPCIYLTDGGEGMTHDLQQKSQSVAEASVPSELCVLAVLGIRYGCVT